MQIALQNVLLNGKICIAVTYVTRKGVSVMPLVKCPDCGKMVSSRANLCPNCGCPPNYFEDEIASEMEKVGQEHVEICAQTIHDLIMDYVNRNEMNDSKEVFEKFFYRHGVISKRIFCKYCGKQIDRMVKYCNYCGKANKKEY